MTLSLKNNFSAKINLLYIIIIINMILVNRYSLLTHFLLLLYKSTSAFATTLNKINISEREILPINNEVPDEIFSITNLLMKKIPYFIEENELRGEDTSIHTLKNFNSTYKSIIFSPNGKLTKKKFLSNGTDKTGATDKNKKKNMLLNCNSEKTSSDCNFTIKVAAPVFLRRFNAFEVNGIFSNRKLENNTETKEDRINGDLKCFEKRNAALNDKNNNFRIKGNHENEEKTDDSTKFIQKPIDIFEKYQHSYKFKRDNHISILFTDNKGNNQINSYDNSLISNNTTIYPEFSLLKKTVKINSKGNSSVGFLRLLLERLVPLLSPTAEVTSMNIDIKS